MHLYSSCWSTHSVISRWRLHQQEKNQYFSAHTTHLLLYTCPHINHEFTMILYSLRNSLPICPDPPDKLKYEKCTVYWVAEICISNNCSFCTHDTNGQSLDSLQQICINERCLYITFLHRPCGTPVYLRQKYCIWKFKFWKLITEFKLKPSIDFVTC